jgi:preprotein translocase subunit YajC
MSFLPLILIIAVFYFILIRPQNKKNKQVSQMRDSLKRGDWVTTIGGFRGRVVKVKEDLLTIEVGADKVKLDVMRWGISKIDESAPDSKPSKKEREEEQADKEEEKTKRLPKRLEKKEEKPANDDAEADDDDDGK